MSNTGVSGAGGGAPRPIRAHGGIKPIRAPNVGGMTRSVAPDTSADAADFRGRFNRVIQEFGNQASEGASLPERLVTERPTFGHTEAMEAIGQMGELADQLAAAREERSTGKLKKVLNKLKGLCSQCKELVAQAKEGRAIFLDKLRAKFGNEPVRPPEAEATTEVREHDVLSGPGEGGTGVGDFTPVSQEGQGLEDAWEARYGGGEGSTVENQTSDAPSIADVDRLLDVMDRALDDVEDVDSVVGEVDTTIGEIADEAASLEAMMARLEAEGAFG